MLFDHRLTEDLCGLFWGLVMVNKISIGTWEESKERLCQVFLFLLGKGIWSLLLVLVCHLVRNTAICTLFPTSTAYFPSSMVLQIVYAIEIDSRQAHAISVHLLRGLLVHCEVCVHLQIGPSIHRFCMLCRLYYSPSYVLADSISHCTWLLKGDVAKPNQFIFHGSSVADCRSNLEISCNSKMHFGAFRTTN